MARLMHFLAAAIMLASATLQAQESGETMSRRTFLGSSGFVLANIFLRTPPDFYQLNYGYWLTHRDVVSIEAITWKYTAPLGIPHGSSHTSPEDVYPGYVREFGLGLAYQRFIWRSLYCGIHALPLLQHYVFDSDGSIQKSFRVFLTFRIGYHLAFMEDRLFLEPSIAITHWPITTNAPAAFAEKDRKWPKYFLAEPGLHVGVRF